MASCKMQSCRLGRTIIPLPQYILPTGIEILDDWLNNSPDEQSFEPHERERKKKNKNPNSTSNNFGLTFLNHFLSFAKEEGQESRQCALPPQLLLFCPTRQRAVKQRDVGTGTNWNRNKRSQQLKQRTLTLCQPIHNSTNRLVLTSSNAASISQIILLNKNRNWQNSHHNFNLSLWQLIRRKVHIGWIMKMCINYL